jgi:hypothetical protein
MRDQSWDTEGWDIRLGHIRFIIAGLFPVE